MARPTQPRPETAISRKKRRLRASMPPSEMVRTGAARDCETAPDLLAAPVLRKLWRVLGKPGISREVVFGANPQPDFFAYSLDPASPDRMVRERADGRKELGRMTNGRFRKIRDLS